jgi:tetratricopeptide (TPR) repeat protein
MPGRAGEPVAADAAAPADPLAVDGTLADGEALEPLGALRARCDALAAGLRARSADEAVAASDRAELKASIVALIRTAAARARAYAALETDAKALAALWKALPEPAPPPPRDPDPAAAATSTTPAAPADGAPARRTTRADHLGASTFGAKGWTAFAAGDYAAAEAAYAQALALAPGDYEAAALHGWALASLGRDDDALLAAQRVLAATPPAGPAALARVTLGRVCLRKGITGEGFEHLTRVTRDDADRRATLYATLHLGQAYTERGMYDDAVAFLRRALALGPNLVEAHYALGRAHWLAGAPDAADEAWRAGAASGKFSPWAARCDEIREHMQGGGDLPAA